MASCSVPFATPNSTQAVSARFNAPVPQSGLEMDQDWWAQFNDATLSELLVLARRNSPDLRTAAAQVVQSRASSQETRAGRLPSVTGNASATRSDGEANPNGRSENASLDARWEIDLFSKARARTNAGRLRAQASQVGFEGAYISLSSQVADT